MFSKDIRVSREYFDGQGRTFEGFDILVEFLDEYFIFETLNNPALKKSREIYEEMLRVKSPIKPERVSLVGISAKKDRNKSRKPTITKVKTLGQSLRRKTFSKSKKDGKSDA